MDSRPSVVRRYRRRRRRRISRGLRQSDDCATPRTMTPCMSDPSVFCIHFNLLSFSSRTTATRRDRNFEPLRREHHFADAVPR